MREYKRSGLTNETRIWSFLRGRGGNENTASKSISIGNWRRLPLVEMPGTEDRFKKRLLSCDTLLGGARGTALLLFVELWRDRTRGCLFEAALDNHLYRIRIKVSREHVKQQCMNSKCNHLCKKYNTWYFSMQDQRDDHFP